MDTITYASAKQLDLIDRLVRERGPAAVELVNAANLTEGRPGGRQGRASQLIDQLFALPKIPTQGVLADVAACDPGPAPEFTPTDEQVEAVKLWTSGESFKVYAFAGAGKTSTLKLMAQATPGRRGYFLAFNKNIIEDAGRKMPGNVTCKTAHSLAYGSTPPAFIARLRNSRRMHGHQIANRLDIDPIALTVTIGGETKHKRLAGGFLASRVMGAVDRFCSSDERDVTVRHFATIDGIDEPGSWDNNNRIALELLPAARAAWRDLCDPNGALPYSHNHYLKQYELSGPRLQADFVMVDEAQDLSPVLMSIVEQQAQYGTQIVLVGDSYQAINGFTGAVDALERTQIELATALTRSFRFGAPIAEAANHILQCLDAPNTIEGNDAVTSTVGRLERATCFLARTNAGAIRRFLAELDGGGKPHLVGGGKQVIDFCEAAIELQDTGNTGHRDLSCFDSWAEVQAYVNEEEQGADLKLMVKLIDEFGAQRIIDSLRNMPNESRATLICSTAHKVKGREWDTVQLAGDFPSGTDKDGIPVEVPAEELQLLYVAVTRAKIQIDYTAVGCLAFIIPPSLSETIEDEDAEGEEGTPDE